LWERYQLFVQKKSSNAKEAAKLREYITTVERGLQGCEILQAVSIKNNEKRRVKALRSAGLDEITKFSISSNKVHCFVSVLSPTNASLSSSPFSSLSSSIAESKRFYPNEIVVAIVDDVKSDDIEISQLLRLAGIEKPTDLSTSSSKLKEVDDGMTFEKVKFSVQPTFLELSLQVCENLRNLSAFYITRGFESTAPRRLRIIGHSSGGAVATYLSLILDGILLVPEKVYANRATFSIVNPTEADGTVPKNYSSFSYSNSSDDEESPRSDNISTLFGKYHGCINCLVLGSPPCISRTIVPKFISCLVNGDDIIPRTHYNSLEQFKKRVIKVLQQKRTGGFSWSFGLAAKTKGILRDIKSVTGKSLSRYKSELVVHLLYPACFYFYFRGEER
jgi:hypothetical protein